MKPWRIAALSVLWPALAMAAPPANNEAVTLGTTTVLMQGGAISATLGTPTVVEQNNAEGVSLGTVTVLTIGSENVTLAGPTVVEQNQGAQVTMASVTVVVQKKGGGRVRRDPLTHW